MSVVSVGSRAFVLGLYFSSIVHVRELPDFLPLVMRDHSNWPRCLVLAWVVSALPGLVRSVSSLFGLRSGRLALGLGGDRAPWADSLGQLAVRSMETVLGGYLVDGAGLWS